MSLPINTESLLTGKTVEWERIEFKKGWNPLSTIQTVCAFANDINNWGGGYIVIGADVKDGQPMLPPIGIADTQIDTIQQELMNLCHELRPNYFPIAEPVIFQGKTVLVIWVPGGELRPYKAPTNLSKPRDYVYFVRHFSTTRRATDQEEKDLIQMSAHIPYDDQVRQTAEITDIKLPLVESYLSEIGSDFAGRTAATPFHELCRKMNIAGGPDEDLKPKNIGLLVFNNNPTSFFPCARIDVVEFKNEEGDKMTEKIFTGPIQQQLQDALLYIKNNIIVERVRKIAGEAKAIRFYNYPFEAIEEALVNTVYHRSYQDDSPIEFRVFPDRIEMISYPGPLPPLNKEKLAAGNIVARKYRNRRIGDFLKELHLTEGRGTGIPKIMRAMARNGSPAPIFDTDDELSYFLTVLPVHPDLKKVQDGVQDAVQDGVQDAVQDGVQDAVQDSKSILQFCLRPKKRREILVFVGVYNNYDNFKKHVRPLIEKGYITPTVPEKPSSGNQQYKTTLAGEKYLIEQTN